MIRLLARLRLATALFWLTATGTNVAAPVEIAPNPDALAQSMQGRRIVLLGEVHDNAALHALRVAALRQWIAQGARPAMAFEQFDRKQQAAIDGARRERPKDADYLIAQAKGQNGWHWEWYRPYVALALEYDLPIVAANLARDDAMHVATQGWPALFDATTRRDLQLDALPADYRRRQEDAIAIGNDVNYGLAAGVWTQNLHRAMLMTERLKAGTVWVNNYRATSFTSPFGGYKRSGVGRESGTEAIKEYLHTKCVWISTDLEVANPFTRR